MYKEIYDNNNIRNKNQLDLSLSNVNWWLEWLKKEKKKAIVNIRKTSLILNVLMTIKGKIPLL